jgi:hypothetical protein
LIFSATSRILCLSALLAAALLLGASLAQQPAAALPQLPPPPPGYVYPTHLTLTYSVDWRVFSAGTVVFHLETQGTQEKITASADTLGAINMLFPVQDRFQSSFDAHTGCSQSFSKQISEGRRRISDDLIFDYVSGKQVQSERNLVKGTLRRTESPIPSCVTDSLSSLFYVAAQSLADSSSYSFPLADAVRNYAVTMRVAGREELRTPAGSFRTVRVQPTTDATNVKNRGQVKIWFIDDPRHIPAQIQVFLFWGTLTFHLQSIQNK